jgi:hypothetical protein
LAVLADGLASQALAHLGAALVFVGFGALFALEEALQAFHLTGLGGFGPAFAGHPFGDASGSAVLLGSAHILHFQPLAEGLQAFPHLGSPGVGQAAALLDSFHPPAFSRAVLAGALPGLGLKFAAPGLFLAGFGLASQAVLPALGTSGFQVFSSGNLGLACLTQVLGSLEAILGLQDS